MDVLCEYDDNKLDNALLLNMMLMLLTCFTSQQLQRKSNIVWPKLLGILRVFMGLGLYVSTFIASDFLGLWGSTEPVNKWKECRQCSCPLKSGQATQSAVAFKRVK